MLSGRVNTIYLTVLVFGLLVIPVSLADTSPDAEGLLISENSRIIGLIPSGSTSPFHQELIAGVYREADMKNWTVIASLPDDETNISFQKNAMRSLIETPVDLISLNTLDSEKTAPEVIEAESAGIPVFMHNTLVPAEDLNVTEYIGYNQYDGAFEMGSYATRILAARDNETPETVHGRVFILRGLPGFHADQRTAGFIAGLSSNPNITVVGEEVAGWDRETARSIATRVLAADSDIDIFYGNSDEMAIGAALAVQDAGKQVNTDVFCLGIDGNSPTLEMIRNGTMTATLGVYPGNMGQIIVQQAEKVLNGEAVPLFLETPFVVVYADNLDAYLNGKTWSEPIASEPERNASEYQ